MPIRDEQPKSNFFKNLGKLFSSNLIAVNLGGKKLKIMDVDNMQFFSKQATNILYDKFNRLYRSPNQAGSANFMGNFPYLQQRLSLFNDYELIDLDPTMATALDIFSDECLSGDTIIPTPDNKNLSIEQLSKIYPDSNIKFCVYSYDEKSKSIKIGYAHSVRKTKTDMTYKIIFSNEKYIIATDNHPILMKNGEYKQVKDLELNDNVMLFDKNINEITNLNYNITKIEPYKIIDVYDMTVDEYHNFATDVCFVHNCSTKNEYGQILTIRSSDDGIKKILHNLFYDILNIQFNLWPWIRNMIKYGDTFLKLDISDKYGIINVIPLSVYEMTREEGANPDNPFEVRFRQDGAIGGFQYKNYEVAHFRLLSDTNFAPYGKSILEPARKIWKQLCLRGDTKIWTPSGYTEIKNMKEGDALYSYDFENGKVINAKVVKWKHNGKDMIYEVRTSHRRIYANKTHPMLIQTGEYKQVQELTSNDFLILPNTIEITDMLIYPNLKLDDNLLVAKLNKDGIKNAKQKIKNSKHIQCKICGSLLKSINHRHLKHHNMSILEYKNKYDSRISPYSDDRFFNGKIKLPLNLCKKILSDLELSEKNIDIFIRQSDSKIIDENILKQNFKNIVRFFGFMLGDGWIDYNRNSISFSLGNRLDKSYKYVKMFEKIGIKPQLRKIKTTKRYCNINSIFFVKLFEQLGFVTGTKNKIIPDWIYQLPSEYQIEFLMGFIDADGCVIENGWSIGGINKNLIYGFQNIAQRNNFICGKISEHNTVHDTIMYTVAIKKSSNRTIKLNNNANIEKIISVLPIEEDDIYDIQVDNDFHNFIADGLVAHNTLMEDAMLIHRIMRAPERRIFYVDVGNIAPNEVDSYMNTMINSMKKTPFVDQKTGDYNLRFNIMNMLEDYYLPVRGANSNTRIDTLPGMTFTGMEDIEYLRKRLLSAIRMPNAFLGYEETAEGKCLKLDTIIPLLNGNKKSLQEIIDDYNNGIKNYVYSIDTKTLQVVPGEIENAAITRRNTQVVRVHLDNGKYVDTTPDHKFMLRNGTYKEAQQLIEGESLMPFNYKIKVMSKNRKNEYEQILHPGTQEWQWTHKMVDEYYNGKIIKNGINENGKFIKDNLIVVHHNDFNRFNNSPENLIRMGSNEHIKIHTNNMQYGLLSEDSLRRSIETKRLPENRKKSSDRQKERIKNNPKLAYVFVNSWMSRTHEERCQICKKGWTPEVKLKQSKLFKKLNKKYKLNETALKGYYKKYPNGRYDMIGELNPKWRTRPTFEQLLDFIFNYKNKNEIDLFAKLCNKFNYHTSIIKPIINENGYTIDEFMNEFIGFKKGRTKDIKIDYLTQLLQNCKSIDEFFKKYNISKKTLKKKIKKNNLDFDNFINENICKTYNHKVIKVEFLEEKVNTGNITVKKYHNFAIDSGIFIKNSTLAALDVRFGRTVERIQQAVISELVKIAIIHLYAQGFTDAKLVDFELSLTQPSTIYEAEKINLWSEKIRVAKDFFDSKLFSDDWIYQNIFNLSDEEIRKEKARVVEGLKLLFRKTQIESEGNDPMVSKESFGTPHDLASMNLIYGRKYSQTPIDFGTPEFNPNPTPPIPGGLWSGNPYSMYPIYTPDDPGRPVEPTHYKTDRHPAGRDPIGQKDLNKSLEPDLSIRPNYLNNSPLREEDLSDLKKKKIKILFEENEINKITETDTDIDENSNNFLNENNIIDDETFE